MKKLTVQFLVSALFLTNTIACAQNVRVTGSKKFITKRADTESFNRLRVQGSPDVIYTQTNGKPSIEIYGADNIVPLIETFVEKQTLIVRFKPNVSINNSGKLEVRVSGPALGSMTVQGSGDITLANGMKTSGLDVTVQGSGDIDGAKIECNDLTVSVQGSGDINFKQVNCNNVRAQVQGSGDVYLTGKSKNATFAVQGSGDVSASGLEAENVTANVSGSGDIRCFATKTLQGKVSGSGDVGYKGDPEISFSKKGLRKL